MRQEPLSNAQNADYSDEEPCPENAFDLGDDGYMLVETAKTMARSLAASPNVTPQQLVGLARALYALERLPDRTLGVQVHVTISRRGGDDDYSEMRFWSVFITESVLNIDSGGSVYSKDTGSDSFTSFDFYAELGWGRAVEGDCYAWTAEVGDALGVATKLTVEDESDPECMEVSR